MYISVSIKSMIRRLQNTSRVVMIVSVLVRFRAIHFIKFT